jgi:glucosyl-3-phosphoglycerate phosphatase
MLSARLILVRHGQSTYNAQARLQGQADPPLSDAGRAEAELIKRAVNGFPADRVLTSDLRRASETAAILGFPEARRDPRFREIDVGAWAGRPLAEFEDEREMAWRGGPAHAADGESWDDMRARVGAAVDELVAAGGSWLVVCHGGAVRAALSHVTGADPRRVAGPANASMTVLRAGDPPRLEAYAWTPDGVPLSGA